MFITGGTMRLKIGEFARLGQISIQTLRYYDTIGLLKPDDVDPFSSYRYYTLEQLSSLVRILALKDMGFSLDQITHLLKEDLEINELRRMLELKQRELRVQLQDQLDHLDRIDARLRWIDQEHAAPACEVILKHVEPLRVASVRGVIPSFWDAGPLWAQLMKDLERGQLSPQAPCFTLCHASEPEIDIEVCAPVPLDHSANSDIHVHTLPGVETMACTIHQGPFTGFITAFTNLVKWIDTNGFTIIGPDREIYLRLPQKGQNHSDPNAITELQIPVQRKSAWGEPNIP
jgi:DNA-binding transcriptional MerR regulator/effector-binding domain-containing protein